MASEEEEVFQSPKFTPKSPTLAPSTGEQQKSTFHEAAEPALPDPKSQRFSALEPDYNTVPTYPLRQSYKDFHSQLRTASRVVVFDGAPDDPYRPASVPIYQTATFEQPCASEYGAYDYTRSGNPTRTALERQVAMLENAHAAFAFATGMAALNAVTRLVKAGDTILVGSDIYGGFHRLVKNVTTMYGVSVKLVETWNLDEVQKALDEDPNVTLVHVETPSNPLMRITDIRALSNILKSKGIILSVDSTMMTPLLQQPINHGADVVVHSMTKFFGGHSDTMGGIVCVANETLARKIAFFQNAEGTGLGPFDCWLFLRGIKTLAVRVQQAQSNAQDIAHFLLRHPIVKNVYYAGLEPNRDEMVRNSQLAQDHKTHMGQAKGGGSVISFTTGNVELSRMVIDNLRLFKLTVSFGSCNSLCEMPATLSHASIPAHERTLPDDLIRLSVGIEDSNDLLEDLQRAFTAAMNSQTAPPSTTPRSVTINGVAAPPLSLADEDSSSSDPKSPSKGLQTRKASSTMHTSDRTKPELPQSANRNVTVVRRTLMTSALKDEETAKLDEELRQLRLRVEAHEKNRGLAMSFLSGLAVAGGLLAVYTQVMSRDKSGR